MLARAIRTSITINRGAGGVSIGHDLDIVRMVPGNSRAFRLVQWPLITKEGKIHNINSLDMFLRHNVQELEGLFRNGSASPFDVDEEGNTLLHVGICVLTFQPYSR